MSESKTMTAEARAARNAYRREWAKKNPEKVREHQMRFWQKQAERMSTTQQTAEGDK